MSCKVKTNEKKKHQNWLYDYKWFFNIRLKQLVSVIHLNISGREFHAIGAWLEKRLSSTLDFLFFGNTSQHHWKRVPCNRWMAWEMSVINFGLFILWYLEHEMVTRSLRPGHGVLKFCIHYIYIQSCFEVTRCSTVNWFVG